MPLTTVREGARIYVTGDTYAVKDQLKDLGCHWDSQRKGWWIGAAKANEIETFVEENGGGLEQPPVVAPPQATDPTEDNVSDNTAYGRAQYKDRTYFVVGKAPGRLQLSNLAGTFHFWTAESKCRWLKEYRPREGRLRSLGELREWIQTNQESDRRRGQCTECGEWGMMGESCSDCHEGYFC